MLKLRDLIFFIRRRGMEDKMKNQSKLILMMLFIIQSLNQALSMVMNFFMQKLEMISLMKNQESLMSRGQLD